jgi:hypothetical protein
VLFRSYCSACGQHAHDSARSIGALFHDAWHLVTHVDGRLWQSLYLLLLRPGRLTQEYFAERRMRYLPPVRLYLVLSVLFFAFGLATPKKISVPPSIAAPDAAAPGKAAADGAAADKAPAARGGSRSTILEMDNCDDIKIPFIWLQNSLRQSCVRNKEDNGVSVEHAFVATIPKMMFLFVPLMALAMLILYWRPRRYYVEHLVFFLHTHAAVFLLLLIQALLGWIAFGAAWIEEWVAAIIGLYCAWYVYRAMRVYYGQGRLLTFTKLCAVGVTYLIGIALTLAATALLSVLIA